MNRRTLLRSLALGAAGLVLDPERLLWVPGQKTSFVPTGSGTITGINRSTFTFWRNRSTGGVWETAEMRAEMRRIYDLCTRSGFPVTGATRTPLEGVTTSRGPVVHPDHGKRLLGASEERA